MNQGRRNTQGAALASVLVLLLLVAGSAASFVWLQNQQQAGAGRRHRADAATALAEAGVHRALAALETDAPDGSGPGRVWRPAAYSETSAAGGLAGTFTISISDEKDGAIAITSNGVAGGITRRLRARARLASPALLAALYGRGLVSLGGPPASLTITGYGTDAGDRPWIHVAAGRGITFTSAEALINDPLAVPETAPGPVDLPEQARSDRAPDDLRPVRLLLAPGAALTIGRDGRLVDVQQLRAMGVRVAGTVVRTEVLPEPPQVHRDTFQRIAAANTANAGLNEAAGRYFGDRDLLQKRDSLYDRFEAERLMAYARAEGITAAWRGVIYIKGGVWLTDGQSLRVLYGALVTESTVYLGKGGALEIIHSPASRGLPGLLVLDGGALAVAQGARLRAHGLVHVTGPIDVGRSARVDIVGSVLAGDPELSFRSHAASVAIRYDPAVMGTPGLAWRNDTPLIAWISAWEELP